jgi:hypothetical protein
MNQNSLQATIHRHAAKLGAYHAACFTKSVTKLIQRHPEAATEDFISGAAVEWARGVAAECARIRAIDAALATMPPGYEALADAAKYESYITADDFVCAALRAHGNATQAMSRMRRMVPGEPGR